MNVRRALGLSMLCALSLLAAVESRAQGPQADLADQFKQSCGITSEAGPSLPGNDVAAAEVPSFFVGDVRRAAQSRVVKIGERYAMRALVPSSADPQHAVFLKCAVAAGSTSFAEQVDRISAMLSVKPILGKTVQDRDFARFSVGITSYSVHSEPDDWVSVYKMDIMMRNIPRKYLKKGAKPVPLPSVR